MKRKIVGIVAAAGLLVVPAVVMVAAPASAAQASVAGTTSPIGQTNAAVWSVAAANGAVYAAGDFTSVRPTGAAAGTGETPRQFMAAWNASGNLLPFSHTFEKPNPDPATSSSKPFVPVRPYVVAASHAGDRIYIGGDFTRVDGLDRFHIAAFDTGTGNLVSNALNVPGSFPVAVGGRVSAIDLSPDDSTVYLGGTFGYVKGTAQGPSAQYSVQQARKNLGAVRNDGLLSGWSATTSINNIPYALQATNSRVFIGGAFTSVTYNGAAVANTYSAASLDPSSGAVQGDFAAGAHSYIPAPTTACTSVVRDIVVDATKAYFAAEGSGSGCFDGTFAAQLSNGAGAWKNGCLGATQAIEVVGSWLYKGSHAHDCQLTNPNGDPDNFPQVPGPSARHLLNQRLDNGFLGAWTPNTDGFPLGPRAMATDGTNLWVAGEFKTVNGKTQQGIARFAPGDAAPYPPLVSTNSPKPGQVKVSVLSPLDLDDTDFNITLSRGGVPIKTWNNVHSLFWKQVALNYLDTAPGSGSQTYTAVATEVNSQVKASAPGSSTVAVATRTSPYVQDVQAAAPSFYWRLSDSVGALSTDWSGAEAGDPGRYFSANGRGAGAIADGNTATVVGGTVDTYGQGPTVYSGNLVPARPTTAPYSVEAWFKTSSTVGGKVVGFGNKPTALSTSYDQQIYLDNAGHVVFGNWNGGPAVAVSPNVYRDNAYHHVVGTQGPGGMNLYVDGVRVAGNASTVHTSSPGYWRVGGDNLNGWPNKPTSNYFNGTIDDVAVYPTALTALQVSSHYAKRTQP